MRLVFMGTPEFAVPSLKGLLRAGHEVALVVTQPDRPAGRGRKIVAPPVKETAISHGLGIIQPMRLRDEEALVALDRARPEVIVVAAFGQILPKRILDLPAHGCVNVHASLLPRWRGAAPINAALLAGDDVTGATIMLMERGLDTGPILASTELPILPSDNVLTLTERLSISGADLLIETLTDWVEGRVVAKPQDPELATYAPQLRKDDGLLDWHRSAVELWRRSRAFYPWPGAFTFWRGRRVKILESAPASGVVGATPGSIHIVPAVESRRTAPYGELLPGEGKVAVCQTGGGSLALLRVQLEGGKAVTGLEWAHAQKELATSRFGPQ